MASLGGSAELIFGRGAAPRSVHGHRVSTQNLWVPDLRSTSGGPAQTHGSAHRVDLAARPSQPPRPPLARPTRAAATAPRRRADDARCNGRHIRPAPTAAAGIPRRAAGPAPGAERCPPTAPHRRLLSQPAGGQPGAAEPPPRGAMPAARHPWQPNSAPVTQANSPHGRTADRAVEGSCADHRGQVARMANSQLKPTSGFLAPTPVLGDLNAGWTRWCSASCGEPVSRRRGPCRRPGWACCAGWGRP